MLRNDVIRDDLGALFYRASEDGNVDVRGPFLSASSPCIPDHAISVNIRSAHITITHETLFITCPICKCTLFSIDRQMPDTLNLGSVGNLHKLPKLLPKRIMCTNTHSIQHGVKLCHQL